MAVFTSLRFLVQFSERFYNPTNTVKWTLLRRDVCRLQSSLTSTEDADTNPEVEPEPSFETIHTHLDNKLSVPEYVKARDVNRLFYSCKTLEQLAQAKDILARFRKSPSHSRNSQPMVVIRKCLQLGAPEEALKMVTDPVKYGLFPMRNAVHTLFMAFFEREDMQGLRKTMQVMDRLEMRPRARHHLFMAKTSFRILLDKWEKTGRMVARQQGAEPEVEEEKKEVEVEEGKEEEKKEVKVEMEEGKKEVEVEEGKKEVKVEMEEGKKEVEVEEVELKLKDLEKTLKLCKQCLSVSSDHGFRALYFVNGYLLELGMFKLASAMAEKLETEDDIPAKLVQNLRLDQRLVCEDLSRALSLLQTMQAEHMEISPKRVARVAKVFEKCDDQTIRQAFLGLKLKE